MHSVQIGGVVPQELIISLREKFEQENPNIFAAIRNKEPYYIKRYFKTQSDSKNPDFQSPLFYAVSLNYAEGVETLILSGADITEKDKHGWTALHHAASNGQYLIAKLLLESDKEKKLSPDTRDNFKNTPLHLAYNNGGNNSASTEDYINVIDILLEYNADINAKNRWGCTPLYVISLHLQYSLSKGARNDLIMEKIMECGGILEENYSKKKTTIGKEILDISGII